MNKLTFLQSLVYSRSLACLCLTETWLSDLVCNGEILPTGYNIYRCDRGSRGGGVLIAVSEEIPSKQLVVNESCEVVVVELSVSPCVIVCCVYVPPNSTTDYHSKVINVIRNLPGECELVIAGDFNCPDINWDALLGTSQFSQSLCSLVYQLNLIQLVDSPTHACGNILDLLLSNSPEKLSNLSILPSLSDHNLIFCDFTLRPPHYTPLKDSFQFDFSQVDFSNLDLFLLNEDFSLVYGESDVNRTWNFITSRINEACQYLIPCNRVKARPSPKWFNGEIKHTLNKVHTLRRHLKRKLSTRMSLKLNNMEVKLQDLMQTAKCKYISSLCQRFFHEHKKLYRYLQDLRNTPQSIPTIIQGSTVIRNPSTIAECFNSYFNSTFTRSNYKLPAMEALPIPASQLSSIVVDSTDVFESLCNLNCDKAVGADGISPRVLKGCATALLEPLTYLFQLCINSSAIPEDWKIHKIKPLPKKGDLTKPSNYRPISLLSIVSKMLESIVYKKIIDFVGPKLNKNQFGFLAGHSCVQQLLRCFDEILENKDLGLPTDVVYLDLRKAFDSVPHDELLLKLWRLGITGSLWKWFRAYLSHRQHFVYLSNENSSLLPVFSGRTTGKCSGASPFPDLH